MSQCKDIIKKSLPSLFIVTGSRPLTLVELRHLAPTCCYYNNTRTERRQSTLHVGFKTKFLTGGTLTAPDMFLCTAEKRLSWSWSIFLHQRTASFQTGRRCDSWKNWSSSAIPRLNFSRTNLNWRMKWNRCLKRGSHTQCWSSVGQRGVKSVLILIQDDAWLLAVATRNEIHVGSRGCDVARGALWEVEWSRGTAERLCVSVVTVKRKGWKKKKHTDTKYYLQK